MPSERLLGVTLWNGQDSTVGGVNREHGYRRTRHKVVPLPNIRRLRSPSSDREEGGRGLGDEADGPLEYRDDRSRPGHCETCQVFP